MRLLFTLTIIKGGLIKVDEGRIFRKFFGENPKKCRVTLQYLCNFVIQVNSKLICSSSLMFATAFIDISLIFVQLGLEKSGKMI